MLMGRFLVIIPALAIAGSLAAKKAVPASAGSFPTHGGLFVGLLVGVILIVGGLTFFPALALGPVVEHLAMLPARPSDRKPSCPDPGPLFSRRRSRARARLGLRQSRPATDDPQPGDVRRRGRGAAHHPPLPRDLATGAGSLGFSFQIILWLWFTLLFANFAEAIAEGRGKAQAASLGDTQRHHREEAARPGDRAVFDRVSSLDLRPGDLVIVEAGDFIPSDGEVIEGIASVTRPPSPANPRR